jgi:hypothetical protein
MLPRANRERNCLMNKQKLIAATTDEAIAAIKTKLRYDGNIQRN